MRRNFSNAIGLAVLLVAQPAAGVLADGRPNQPFAQQATWRLPEAEMAREQVFDWLAGTGAEEQVVTQADALWQTAAAAGNATRLLDLACATFALADPEARALFETCSQPRGQAALPETGWLVDDARSPLMRHNLRLLYGRWLVQELLYDEALEQLEGLQPADVLDPGALLFYQAVVYHRMLQRDPGLAAIARLLENEDAIPRRFASVARLMQADLEGLEDESLDHIARRMEDIERRLDLGRAGKKVREVEDGVIASLDKLIEQMEQQQQAAAAAAAARQQGGGQQQMPLQPLQDSLPMQGKGEGNVDKKPIGNGSGWGDLPPHERQEALQQIGKEFPAHYRDLIEQYFRDLATEGEQAEK